MTSSDEHIEQIARLQSRQRIALIVLSISLAVSTIVTWKSLDTMREANELRRQLRAAQTADPAPKSARERRSGSRAGINANSELRRPTSLPGGQQRAANREAVIPGNAGTNVASAHAQGDHPGRQ